MDGIHPTPDNALNNINQFPDFSEQGYSVERELGYNLGGGRVTYKAVCKQTQQPVVIKQFQFAKTGASWSGYEALQQEIEILQQLKHPSIPQYLGSFETTNGFCLVQEYKDALSLAQPQYWTTKNIQQIAIAVLEVLVYLQQQVPPVIHRDIKPENILVDDRLNVYLVDFGLARIGGEDLTASSVVKGTLGFIPPEAMFGRGLTLASDLYSLGATLICLLTKTPSTRVGDLIDDTFQFNFKSFLPSQDFHLIPWLEKMVASNPQNRYANAANALSALKAINIINIAPPVALQPKNSNVSLLGVGLLSAIALLSVIRQAAVEVVTPEPIKIYTPAMTSADAIRQLVATQRCINCNLRWTDLRGMDLRSIDFTNADLTGADLRGADLRGASLVGADLTAARLEGANIGSTDFRGAIMPDGSIYGF
jgi:serine/threonine protein kinase